MKIISCHIENFGKLSNFTYEFSEGCNVICQKNGWGKSTFAAFLKVMFFGFAGESKRSPSENERKRYAPWQKGVYGGELTFETKGKRYSVRRVFGQKAAEDEFFLSFADTRLPSSDFTKQLGEELFSIDADGFLRTVFLSQNDCGTCTTDSINAKIGNLAENTDDINNYETVNKKLQDMLNEMSPTRKTGSLSKMKQKSAGLLQDIRMRADLEKTVADTAEKRKNCILEREGLQERQKDLRKQQKNLSTDKDLQAKREKYLDLQQEYDRRLALLKKAEDCFNGVIPAKKDLEEMLEAFYEAERAKNEMDIYRLSPREEAEAARLKAPVGTRPLDNSELEKMAALAKEYESLQMELLQTGMSKEEQERLAYYRESYGCGLPDEAVIEGWKQQWRVPEALPDKRKRPAGGVNKLLLSIGAGALLLGMVLLFISGLLLSGNMAVIICGAGMIGAGLLTGLFSLIFRKKTVVSEEEQRKRARQEEEYFRRAALLDRELEDYEVLLRRSRQLEESGILQRLEELQKELEIFLCRYSHRQPEENRGYVSEIHLLKEQKERCASLLEKQNHFQKAEERQKELLGRIGQYLASIHLLEEDHLGEQLKKLLENVRIYQVCRQEAEDVQKQLDAFRQKEDVPRLLAFKTDAGAASLEQLSREMTNLSEESDRLFETIQGYGKRLEDLQQALEETLEKKAELEALEEQIQEGLSKYRLLKKTKELLEQAKTSFTARYTEPLMGAFQKYYLLLSGRDGENFQMDANTRISVIEQNMPREIGFQSCGRQDLIGICMRMALAEAMYRGEKPFLVMDDPFVNLDAEKTEGGMAFLRQVSREYQIIYFTCHQGRTY